MWFMCVYPVPKADERNRPGEQSHHNSAGAAVTGSDGTGPFAMLRRDDGGSERSSAAI